MDDMNAFERLVAEETRAEAGPPRPIDVAAVVRAVATKSPKWRFWSMFTATKTLAATTVVALVGGFLLIGPFQSSQQAEVVPAAEVDPVKPVEFHARWARAGGMDRGEVASHGDLVTYRDQRFDILVVEPGDPRLDGDVALVANSDQYSGVYVSNGYYTITTADGAWRMQPAIHGLRLTGESSPSGYTAVFEGEGAYEGLVAVLRFGDSWLESDIDGVIFEAPLPPEPPIGD